jgi:KipI family sensor histidine kinase inhibitor
MAACWWKAMIRPGLRDKSPVPGVSDFVPAESTILVHVEAGTDLSVLRRQLSELNAGGLQPGELATLPIEVSIAVRYDGPDLDEVARRTGQSRRQVIARHSEALWRCDFIGFAPGFSYLTSDAKPITVPRRDQSRARVPAGSVALAGRYSAVYPRASPGGWQVIGTTAAPMWDVSRQSPALVTPGALVRFVEQAAGPGRCVIAL